MRNNLTANDIEQIRTYLRNRGIETIDLEHEMADHIACAVEEKMAEGESFYDAFKTVIAEFGPHGMKKVQSEHNRELRRKGYYLFWKYFKRYFSFPLIFLPFALVLIFYLIYFPIEKYTLPIVMKYRLLPIIIQYSAIIIFTLFSRLIFRCNLVQRRALERVLGIGALIWYCAYLVPAIFWTFFDIVIHPQAFHYTFSYASALFALIVLAVIKANQELKHQLRKFYGVA